MILIIRDLSDVKGQSVALRALEIAASGGHNILMSGAPGAGKSMLASRLIGILPQMSAEEILECTMVASIAGSLVDGKLQHQRPFRSPHHSCSMAAMVGGGMGKRVVPGEISRAHNGVLFLDELPEFPRAVLDALRQPIETGDILISRVNSHVTYPARFQLVAAMNPCRCGYLSDPERCCNRAPNCAVDYQAKISGPILDRIDLHIEVPNLSMSEMSNHTSHSVTSQEVAVRVQQARDLQLKRYDGYGIRTNAQLDGKLLVEIAAPSNEGQELLNNAAEKMKLSMRGYNRMIRLARTIADLDESNMIHKHHIAEALSYRQLTIKRMQYQ